jgi:hypothetical protein
MNGRAVTLRLRIRLKRGQVVPDPATQNATLQEICNEHFGSKWLQAWNATSQETCHPAFSADGIDAQTSSMRCRLALLPA